MSINHATNDLQLQITLLLLDVSETLLHAFHGFLNPRGMIGTDQKYKE